MASTAMSSPVERPKNLSLGSKQKTRVTFNEASLSQKTTSSTDVTNKKCPSEIRRRKRTHSCSLSWDFTKRRRSSIVLPSKFLLGGNITDPLNLEALDEEDPNRVDENKNTNGRRGGTVRVIIPPNINDPLNLDACSEDGDHQLADAILKQRKRRKPRKRRRRNSEPGGLTYTTTIEERLSTSLEEKSPEAPPQPCCSGIAESLTKSIGIVQRQMSEPAMPVVANMIKDTTSSIRPPPPSTLRVLSTKKCRTKVENKIVSPVVPQPGVERKRNLSSRSSGGSTSSLVPVKNQKNVFQYGNYNQYYGYRNPMGQKNDPRLECLRPEWFAGKEVLDIGCNIGHITLSIGRDWEPYRAVGIDIDKKLINIAQKNIKHYLREEAHGPFPKSMRLLYGPIRPSVDCQGRRPFPHNVRFYQGNYVMENDALLSTVRPEFDTILCLSITKWIHLNWGDAGLKRFFRRIYLNLRPRGIFVLEPQGWPSYTKKRKITPEIHENYKSIKLFPEKFSEFLTKEVGFSYVQKLTVPQHFSKGFQRPIYIFSKDARSKEDPNQIQLPVESKTSQSSDSKKLQTANESLKLVSLVEPKVTKSLESLPSSPSRTTNVISSDTSCGKSLTDIVKSFPSTSSAVVPDTFVDTSITCIKDSSGKSVESSSNSSIDPLSSHDPITTSIKTPEVSVEARQPYPLSTYEPSENSCEMSKIISDDVKSLIIKSPENSSGASVAESYSPPPPKRPKLE